MTSEMAGAAPEDAEDRELREQELLVAVRAGSVEAIAALYQGHRAGALAFARSLARDHHDAEDVLQDAFLSTFLAMANGSGPRNNFAAYLTAAIKSSAARVWKKSSREMTVEAATLDAVSEPQLDERLNAILDAAAGAAASERISAARQSLPLRWQQVLLYADILGEPPRRIGPLMGISPNAASALLQRARSGLRDAYNESGNTNREDLPDIEVRLTVFPN